MTDTLIASLTEAKEKARVALDRMGTAYVGPVEWSANWETHCADIVEQSNVYGVNRLNADARRVLRAFETFDSLCSRLRWAETEAAAQDAECNCTDRHCQV